MFVGFHLRKHVCLTIRWVDPEKVSLRDSIVFLLCFKVDLPEWSDYLECTDDEKTSEENFLVGQILSISPKTCSGGFMDKSGNCIKREDNFVKRSTSNKDLLNKLRNRPKNYGRWDVQKNIISFSLLTIFCL